MQLPEQSALVQPVHLPQGGIGIKIGPYQLLDPATGKPVDLSSAFSAAFFTLVRTDPPPQTTVQSNQSSGVLIETPTTAGRVSYTTVAGDLATAGDYVAEFWTKVGGTTPDTNLPISLKIPIKVDPSLSATAP